MSNPPKSNGIVAPLRTASGSLRYDARIPNRIAEARLSPQLHSLRLSLLVALMVAVLIPRVIMAMIIPTICVDGTVYISAAESIERSGLGTRSGHALNLYPVILAGLNRLGLSWEAAGSIWGVGCSVLAVLPLFGWVRRQFDDRTAIVACLIYAGHPKLIEWAPELIREQSFWLLFITGLYCSWRAAVEARFGYYFTAAIAIAAATFTRFEGLFLFIPLLYWTFARFLALRSGRARLFRSFGLTFVAIPCVLLVVQLLCLRSTPIKECLHAAPLERLNRLVHSFLGDEKPTVIAADHDNFGDRPGAFSTTTLGKTMQVVFRGLTPPYAALLLIGIITQGRRTFASDRLPAVLVSLVTITAIWIHTWYSGLASSRYILTVALFSTGTAAAGLLDVCRGLSRFTAENHASSRQRVAAATLLASAFIYGCVDAFFSNYSGRRDRAELGVWLRDRYGSDHVIYGSDEQLDLIAYYAKARCVRLPTNRAASLIDQEVVQVRPDIVLVSTPPLPQASYEALAHSAARLGMAKLDVPASNTRRPIIMTSLEAHSSLNR